MCVSVAHHKTCDSIIKKLGVEEANVVLILVRQRVDERVCVPMWFVLPSLQYTKALLPQMIQIIA